MTDIPFRLAEHLRRRRLFPRRGTAILAVSGGPDSVALLDLLARLAPELGLELVVAHADHGIQTESRNVGKTVRELAKQYRMPFELGELKLGSQATETAAREARWTWLRDVARRRGATYIVTAHHWDDQVETVLLRVLRGSGPAGLAGMAARTKGGVVRPLLPFRRGELEAHVATRGLLFHDDPANRDPHHLRSWIRTTLLPQLVERLGPRVADDLARLARHAARDRRAWAAALEGQAALELHHVDGGFEVARATLAHYDKTLAVALLRAAARQHGLTLGPGRAARLATLARGPSGRRVELGQGWVGEAAFDRLRVVRTGAAGVTETALRGEEGAISVGPYALRWRTDIAPSRLTRTAWTTWLPEGSAWVVRGVRQGDRMRPLGGTGHRSVRRLLMEARVPASLRGTYPVVTAIEETGREEGEGKATVLWVPGVCRGVAAVPEPGTRAVRIDVTESEPTAAHRR